MNWSRVSPAVGYVESTFPNRSLSAFESPLWASSKLPNMTATSEFHAVGCAVTASRRAVDEELRISQVEIASQARARWGWVRVGIEAVCRIEAKRGERSGLGESQNGPFGGGGGREVFDMYFSQPWPTTEPGFCISAARVSFRTCPASGGSSFCTASAWRL